MVINVTGMGNDMVSLGNSDGKFLSTPPYSPDPYRDLANWFASKRFEESVELKIQYKTGKNNK